MDLVEYHAYFIGGPLDLTKRTLQSQDGGYEHFIKTVDEAEIWRSANYCPSESHPRTAVMNIVTYEMKEVFREHGGVPVIIYMLRK